MRPHKLDSNYLSTSNGRLNPAVIRCNIDPAAAIWWPPMTFMIRKAHFEMVGYGLIRKADY